MHPERAARFLSILGVYLLVAALILRVVSLTITSWQARMGWEDTATQPTIPTVGQYRPSPDRKQVIFSQQIDSAGNTGWFSMPLEGGAILPAEQPQEDISPFLVEDQQIFVQLGEEPVMVNGLPGNSELVTYSRSPDTEMLAFVNEVTGNGAGLFLLSNENKLYWLGDHDRINEIVWSPDSQNLAFIAHVNETSQIFIIRRDGQVEHQLTTELTYKSNLRWSPDGHTIAYLASTLPERPSGDNRSYYYLLPIPENSVKWSIRLIGIDGANPRQFIEDELIKFNLDWGMEGPDPVLLYSILLPNQIDSSHLYTLNPRTDRIRQAYPPVKITSFTCPAQIPVHRPGVVHISLNNTGLSQAGVSLVLRARSRAFAALSPYNENDAQSKIVQVPPGSDQTVEWPLRAQPGFFTHISAGINPNGLLAMDERRCVIKNSYFGLPNLPFLGLMLPLVLIGVILCIPWLRIKRKWAVGALYLAVPILTVVILIIETSLVGL